MTRIKQTFGLLVVAAALAGGVFASSASAVASNYQFPCFPLDQPDYGFGQYIGGGWGYHLAEDICHQAGVPMYATADGVVVYSAKTPDSYRWGNLIIIEHTNPDGGKVVSLYGHLANDRAVGAGQAVSRGQYIGKTGQSGSENGFWDPHVHYGIHPGPYNAAVGSYASWVHGYDANGTAGWVGPTAYAGARLPTNDQQPAGAVGHGQMYFNGDLTIHFFVDNSGATTWRAGTANPTRIGTVNPMDRISGFFNDDDSRWINGQRISLVQDTPPGQRGRFTATFKSPGQVGRFPECFSVIQENVAWLPVKPLCPVIDVLPPGYRYQTTNQTASTTSSPTNLSSGADTMTLLPGQQRNLKFFMKNVGELPWDVGGANPVRLGTVRPTERGSAFATIGDSTIPASENWLAAGRASTIDGRYDSGSNSVVADTQITTGETAVFSFTVTAPDTPGTYQEFFDPVVEGKQWLPDNGAAFTLRVLAPGNHYGYVSQTSGSQTQSGGTTYQDVTLRLQNIGRTSWPVGGALRLGTDRPRDHVSPFMTPSGTGAWVSSSRPSTVTGNVTSPGKTTIDPGEVASFGMRITIPDTLNPGSYPLYVRPVLDGVEWLPEDYGIYFPITVANTPPYAAAFMGQRFSSDPANATPGSQITVNLALKNTGRKAWSVGGANPVRLGTNRPLDRASIFATMSGGDPWLSANRASGIDGRITNQANWTVTSATQINPNETAIFTMVFTMPNTTGTYKEYFLPVAEGISWLNDLGIFFPFTVKSGGGGGVPAQPVTGPPVVTAAPSPVQPKPSATP